MALTVGELVGFIDLEDEGFTSELDRAGKALEKLQSTTTAKTAQMESTVTRSMAQIERAIDDGTDSTEAVAELKRIEEAIDRLDKKTTLEIDAEITEALAALGLLEAAAGEAGEQTATRFWQDANGKWHDESGKFVSASSAMFDGVTAGAEKSAGLLGKVFNSAFSSIGETGPMAVVKIAAAIELLPVAAKIAAAGVGTLLGAALLSVGIKAALGADTVQRRWKLLGDQIGDGLDDAAQPLEGSALRAADVVERAFRQLQPSLARVFRDLVPDVDHFVSQAGAGLATLGPSLEQLGDAFGSVLSALGDRMPAIMLNIQETIDTFTEMMNDDPQMLANLIEDATAFISVLAEILQHADLIHAILTVPINPTNLADYALEAMGVVTAQQVLEDQAEQLPTALGGLTKGLRDAMQQADETQDKVKSLSDELARFFNPAQNALSASNNFSKALKEVRKQLEEGKPSLLERKMALEDLLGALATKAEAEKESTGATTASTKAFEDNAAMLTKLAGESAEGGQALIGLAQSLGYTVDETKKGIKITDEFGKTITTIPNNKNIDVKADTAQAQREVGKVSTKLDNLKGDAKKAGQDVGSGLIAGIKSLLGDAMAAAKSLGRSVIDAFKKETDSHSPSREFEQLGKWTVQGLVQGIRAEESTAVEAVEQMVDKIKEAFESEPDVADGLIAFISRGNDSLKALAEKRDELVERLANAKEYAKKVAGDAREWADITGMSEDEINSGDFSGALQNRAQSIKDFANNIKSLAERGLNKTTLQQIIDAGVEKGGSFAEMLVGADGSEIKAINKAQKMIDKMSTQLGKNGADAMYDTGKKAGEGYLKGLTESLAKLDKEMKKIVDALVRAIKKELKIKSPSQVMADIGTQTMAGLVVGMQSMASAVMDSATGLVRGAIQGAQAAVTGGGMGSIGTAPGTIGRTSAVAGLGLQGVPYQAQQPGQQAPAAAGIVVNVDQRGSTIREDLDMTKYAREAGFQVAVQA
ncbi:hypothetical protein HII36_29720 [Nonomuraea sp. NN258]|uniref:hypothetical protein n=1 Tax=Nonomuraea antri TaxID=2730852 RepID=UPI001569516D|nr:hypothetical protein [Nonomuraea antri]NRQ35980.1 hypothetical protein [Nonomuraea antri]